MESRDEFHYRDVIMHSLIYVEAVISWHRLTEEKKATLMIEKLLPRCNCTGFLLCDDDNETKNEKLLTAFLVAFDHLFEPFTLWLWIEIIRLTLIDTNSTVRISHLIFEGLKPA